MLFLIKLPPVWGGLLTVFVSLAFTAALFIITHIFLRGKRPTEYKNIAQQMSLRIGTMHALVMALVFSTLNGELINLSDLSDAEAMSAANIYYSLKHNQSDEATRLRALIPIYLKTVIEKDWEELSQMQYKLPAWELISKMQKINFEWATTNASDEMLNGYVFNNLNTMADNRNKRVIERQAPTLPTVFWVIAFSGYFLTLLPYLTIELNTRRLFLICTYAIMIGLLFYGIAVLDKPFLSRVIKPVSFEVMYNDISKDSLSSPLEEK